MWKMAPSNISFLSFRIFVHFHDYGRKGKYPKNHWTLQSRGLNLYSKGVFLGPQNKPTIMEVENGPLGD